MSSSHTSLVAPARQESRRISDLIAPLFAQLGFMVALVCGIIADASATAILARATLALVACFIIGWMVVSITARVIHNADEHKVQGIPADSRDQDARALGT